MSDLVPSLVAERQARLNALGARPPWWKPFARRRFDRQHVAIMAMDCRWSSLILRRFYSSERTQQIVDRQLAIMAFLAKPVRAPPAPCRDCGDRPRKYGALCVECVAEHDL